MPYYLLEYSYANGHIYGESANFDIIYANEDRDQHSVRLLASSIDLELSAVQDWDNAKEIQVKDFPLYISSAKFTTQNFKNLLQGKDYVPSLHPHIIS